MSEIKSIEQAAEEYCAFIKGHCNFEKRIFIAGAKHQKELSDAREKLLLDVVNELISEIKLTDALNRKTFHADVCLKSMACHCSKKENRALAKADQLLKEMGIK